MGTTWEVGNDGRMLLKSFSSDPAGSEGMVVYNSTAKKLKYHNGTSWVSTGGVQIGPSSGGQPDASNTQFPAENTFTSYDNEQTLSQTLLFNVLARASPLYRGDGGAGASGVFIDGKGGWNDYYNQTSDTVGGWFFGDMNGASQALIFNAYWFSGSGCRQSYDCNLVSVLYGNVSKLIQGTHYTVDMRYAYHLTSMPANPSVFSGYTVLSGTPWPDITDMNQTTGYTMICPGAGPSTLAFMAKINALSFTGNSARLYFCGRGSSLWTKTPFNFVASFVYYIWNNDTSSWEALKSMTSGSNSQTGYMVHVKDILAGNSTTYVDSGGAIYLLVWDGTGTAINDYTGSFAIDEIDLWGGYANPQ